MFNIFDNFDLAKFEYSFQASRSRKPPLYQTYSRIIHTPSGDINLKVRALSKEEANKQLESLSNEYGTH